MNSLYETTNMTIRNKISNYGKKEIFLIFFCFLTIVAASLIDPHELAGGYMNYLDTLD